MPGVTITHFANAASVYHVYVSLFCWAVVSCMSAVLESSGNLNRDLAPPQILWIRTSRDGSWESIFWKAPSIYLIQPIFPLAFGSPSCILQTPQGDYKLKSRCFFYVFLGQLLSTSLINPRVFCSKIALIKALWSEHFDLSTISTCLCNLNINQYFFFFFGGK